MSKSGKSRILVTKPVERRALIAFSRPQAKMVWMRRLRLAVVAIGPSEISHTTKLAILFIKIGLIRHFKNYLSNSYHQLELERGRPESLAGLEQVQNNYQNCV